MAINTDIAMDRMLADKRDPWVVVGTTTIDGPLKSILKTTSNLLDWDEPRMIGGRWLRFKRLDGPTDVTLVVCDIVRRQSEIDAEMIASVVPVCNELAVTMRAVDPCPECGPHGNSGRVLLLESWVDCTTCRPRPTHLVIEGGSGAPLVIDLEKDAIEVPRGKARIGTKRVISESDGLAYPTADDVRSFTPPPIPIRFTFNDDTIRAALRALDDAVWDMARTL